MTFIPFLGSNKYYEHLILEEFLVLYNVLIAIDEDIAPSNDFCAPFKEYAINCVTQSNSKKARLNRFAFFESLLVNSEPQPNYTQKLILDYYELEHDSITSVGNYFTIDYNKIFELKEISI